MQLNLTVILKALAPKFDGARVRNGFFNFGSVSVKKKLAGSVLNTTELWNYGKIDVRFGNRNEPEKTFANAFHLLKSM